MNERVKKKQHYVWRNYLKPWIKDNKIWCRMGNRIFQTSPVNIGNETYFYKVNELNDFEKKMITYTIKKFPIENWSTLLNAFTRYNFYGKYSDESQKNGLENYHNFIENNFVPILNKLYKKDLSFFYDNDMKAKFSYFLGLQNFRTKKMLKNPQKIFDVIQTPDEYKGKFNPENIIKIYGLLFAECMGNWIHSKGKIYFFESEYDLIVSDQPIINIRADYSLTAPKRVEYYYPLTTNLAIFITDKILTDRILKKEDAIFFNNQMYKKSHEQIYSKTQELLLSL